MVEVYLKVIGLIYDMYMIEHTYNLLSGKL